VLRHVLIQSGFFVRGVFPCHPSPQPATAPFFKQSLSPSCGPPPGSSLKSAWPTFRRSPSPAYGIAWPWPACCPSPHGPRTSPLCERCRARPGFWSARLGSPSTPLPRARSSSASATCRPPPSICCSTSRPPSSPCWAWRPWLKIPPGSNGRVLVPPWLVSSSSSTRPACRLGN
jgi:hypothetical protein